MGKRVESAPTFDAVITLQEARSDSIIAPDNVVLPQADEDNTVHFDATCFTFGTSMGIIWLELG